MDRPRILSMALEFLHYLSRSARSRREVYNRLDRDGTFERVKVYQVWARCHYVAGSSQVPGGGGRADAYREWRILTSVGSNYRVLRAWEPFESEQRGDVGPSS